MRVLTTDKVNTRSVRGLLPCAKVASCRVSKGVMISDTVGCEGRKVKLKLSRHKSCTL